MYHDVFLVSLLKVFKGEVLVAARPLLEEWLSMPQAIRRSRLNRGHLEVLVQWIGVSPIEATWETYEKFCRPTQISSLRTSPFSTRGLKMWTPLWGKHTNAEGNEGESGWIMLYQPLKEDFLFLKEDFYF